MRVLSGCDYPKDKEDLSSGGGREHNKADGARIVKRKVAENQTTL